MLHAHRDSIKRLSVLNFSVIHPLKWIALVVYLFVRKKAVFYPFKLLT